MDIRTVATRTTQSAKAVLSDRNVESNNSRHNDKRVPSGQIPKFWSFHQNGYPLGTGKRGYVQ
jgi:hypothetical protein